MKQIEKEAPVTIEKRIEDCIDQEARLLHHYNELIKEIAPDAELVMKQLCYEHEKHVVLLERLRSEIQMLRELSMAMAD